MDCEHLCLTQAVLFFFDENTNAYTERGQVGCTIVGSNLDSKYKLGCYNDKDEYICTADITANNEGGANISLQGCHVSFRDDEGKLWSLQFSSSERAVEFCANVTVAMYGSAGQPQENIIVCDVAHNTTKKQILTGDSVTAQYRSWVVAKKSSLPTLGSELENNTDQSPISFIAPFNHLGVTDQMKGFEGLSLGMSEGGCRFIIIPKGMKRGSGPFVHACYYVQIHNVKSNGELGSSPGQLSAMPLLTASASFRHDHKSTPQQGFSRDQFLLVDHLRDQVFSLSEQLRCARQEIATLTSSIHSYERSMRPSSLANAQVEESIHKMIVDTDAQVSEVAKADNTIKSLEEHNARLQGKLEKMLQTAKLLEQEKKVSITQRDEDRLEMDRQILHAQSHHGMLQTEQEDILRHTTAVKNLIDIAVKEIKREQSQLQVSLVSFQTNESKLSNLESSHREESERCAVLESQLSSLGDELRGLKHDVRTADDQIESCKRKMDSDALYFSKLLDEEREHASTELRELQEDLIAELTAREARNLGERQRLSQEAFEQGRLQGMGHGQSDGTLEGDVISHELNVNLQRTRAELEALQIRLRAVTAEKASDEKRIEAEIAVLLENAAHKAEQAKILEAKVHAAEVKCDSHARKVFTRLESSLHTFRGEQVTKRALLDIIGAVELGRDPDFSAASRDEHQEQRRLEQERQDVIAWVRAAAYNQAATIPPLGVPYFFSSGRTASEFATQIQVEGASPPPSQRPAAAQSPPPQQRFTDPSERVQQQPMFRNPFEKGN